MLSRAKHAGRSAKLTWVPLGEAEAVRWLLDFLIDSAERGEWQGTEEALTELEALHHRALELSDRLAWIAEAPDDHASFAEAEVRAWEERFQALPEEQRSYFDALAKAERQRPTVEKLP